MLSPTTLRVTIRLIICQSGSTVKKVISQTDISVSGIAILSSVNTRHVGVFSWVESVIPKHKLRPVRFEPGTSRL